MEWHSYCLWNCTNIMLQSIIYRGWYPPPGYLRYLRYNFWMAWAIITIYASKCAQMDPQQLPKTSNFYSRCKKCDVEKTLGRVPLPLVARRLKGIDLFSPLGFVNTGAFGPEGSIYWFPRIALGRSNPTWHRRFEPANRPECTHAKIHGSSLYCSNKRKFVSLTFRQFNQLFCILV